MRVQFFGCPKDGHERKLPDDIQAQSYEWRFPLPYPQVVQASDYYVKYLVPFPVFIISLVERRKRENPMARSVRALTRKLIGWRLFATRIAIKIRSGRIPR
jgi:hypothetical protein